MRAGVIGGGTMGAGIACVLARGGYDVIVVETSVALAERAVETARALIDEGVRRGKLEPEAAAAARERVRGTDQLADLGGGATVVVEAVPERIDLKRKVLRAAETLDPALLATNTSGISVDLMAAGLRRPERFLGLHFFNPVPAMALVEVVLGAATAAEAHRAALDLVERIGKEAVVVRDSPGFASTRLGMALGLEAIRMVEEGVAAPADIDRAMELGYRHPVGPLRLTDLVGLDVRLDSARNLADAHGSRFQPPALLERMVVEGRLGRKTGEGFYRWPSP